MAKIKSTIIGMLENRQSKFGMKFWFQMLN